MAVEVPGACSIKASADEVRQGRLTERKLELAIRHLYEDGLVVVEDVIDHEVLDHLNHKMVEDAMLLSSRGENSPFNYNRSNLQQDAPPIREYFDPSIFFSKFFHRQCNSASDQRRSHCITYHHNRAWT